MGCNTMVSADDVSNNMCMRVPGLGVYVFTVCTKLFNLNKIKKVFDFFFLIDNKLQ